MHPSLEPIVKAELNKLLTAWIIFSMRHPQWVANLVPIQKKNGDIRLCVDFQNLNKASDKDLWNKPCNKSLAQRCFLYWTVSRGIIRSWLPQKTDSKQPSKPNGELTRIGK